MIHKYEQDTKKHNMCLTVMHAIFPLFGFNRYNAMKQGIHRSIQRKGCGISDKGTYVYCQLYLFENLWKVVM